MRKPMALAALLLTALKLGGCALAAEPDHDSAPSAFATCQDAADYYGARAGEPLQEPIPYKLYRVLPPGSFMTMDFNPERLNVYTDQNGLIIKATCG